MLNIQNKIKFENNLWVAEVDVSNANNSQEERIKFVTDISSICMGKLGFDDRSTFIKEYPHLEHANVTTGKYAYEMDKRQKLYNKLLIEAAGKASTPFEFIPIRFKLEDLYNLVNLTYSMGKVHLQNNVFRYSYFLHNGKDYTMDGCDYILTNMRCLLNAGISEEDIPFNTPEEVEGFKVILTKQPKVSYDHLITHRSLSRICESSRNKKYLNEVEFHYDTNKEQSVIEKLKENDEITFLDIEDMVSKHWLKAEDATKELSCRRLVLSAWCAWKQDPNTWDNLFAQRAVGHTQAITKQVVDNIKNINN